MRATETGETRMKTRVFARILAAAVAAATFGAHAQEPVKVGDKFPDVKDPAK
jgi:hypothetical protein